MAGEARLPNNGAFSMGCVLSQLGVVPVAVRGSGVAVVVARVWPRRFRKRCLLTSCQCQCASARSGESAPVPVHTGAGRLPGPVRTA